MTRSPGRLTRSPLGDWWDIARGSLGVAVLAPHEAFGMHPLMTVTGEGAQFAGAGAAVAGSSSHALRQRAAWPRRSR